MSVCKHDVEMPDKYSSIGGCYNCLIDRIIALEAMLVAAEKVVEAARKFSTPPTAQHPVYPVCRRERCDLKEALTAYDGAREGKV